VGIATPKRNSHAIFPALYNNSQSPKNADNKIPVISQNNVQGKKWHAIGLVAVPLAYIEDIGDGPEDRDAQNQ
jgi:hypothetical protein